MRPVQIADCDETMPSRSRRFALFAIFGGVGLLVAVVVIQLYRFWQPGITAAAPLPAISPSSALNTQPNVAYVGMNRCKSCHAEAHASYLETAHSQALAKVDATSEPPDGEFDDPRSQRHYRIYRDGGTLRHAESIRTAAQETLLLADFPIKYVIGSGRFSRSYLIEADGFLFESPATWYSAKSAWGLSPGYDRTNAGFQRPVELRCLTCHAGRVEPIERSPQKVQFHAQSIDCERCHGPGALHVARHESTPFHQSALLSHDPTIVNPAHLDRQRREDLCNQCHLHGAATVELRGRSLHDFRPGQLLADYATHFGILGPKQRMEVVGHAEQMHLSRCYQSSDTLTCTTCHDPHATPSAREIPGFYRQKCLSCHATEACGQPLETRQQSDPADNCVTCHMPRGPTEIPHFAFTHHRIGIHSGSTPAPDNSQPAELVPISENVALSTADRFRSLGLAYLQLVDNPGQAQHAETYRGRALNLLLRPDVQSLTDSRSEAALARLYLNLNPQLTLQHAHAVAESAKPAPEDWATACFTLGSTYYQLNNPQAALPWLEKTVQLRPTADVWIMLSDCWEHQQLLDLAVEAARRATELAPDRPRYLMRYAELLGRTGQSAPAAKLQTRIQDLFEYRKRVDTQTHAH